MLIHSLENHQIVKHEGADPNVIPADVLWIDLLNPTREEEQAVEQYLGIEIPTREEMLEIELSNRLLLRR
jgi:magnesium transporter